MDNNVLVEKVIGWLLTPGGSLGVSLLAFGLGLMFFRSKIKELIIHIKFKGGETRRWEEGTSKGDDVRSPPGDTAPIESRSEGRTQGLEGGRAPEKREEQPAAVPMVRPVRRWAGKPVAGLVAVLVIVGGGYFGWATLEAQREKRAQEEQVKVLLVEAKAGPAVLAGEMVEIPGGTFRMGDLSGEGDDVELPVHSVTVSSFWMGKHEVTFLQWDACVADGGCGGYSPDDSGFGRGNRPVIWVSWDDIQEFIVWLNRKTGGGYRLPTESEWEYAARAGSESKYSWGDEIGVNRANCAGCGSQWDNRETAPVGSFPANAWGLHDMHGNVWEWVEDCRNRNYRGAPVDGSAWLSGGCGQRVIRGGSASLVPWLLRSSFRNRGDRSVRGPDLGFRLARDR